MVKNTIADRTIKDLFIALLGEENANAFLAKLQSEYDHGKRGKELENYAQDEIRKYHMADPGSTRTIVSVVQIVFVVEE